MDIVSPDQTVRMQRLIWVNNGRMSHKVDFLFGVSKLISRNANGEKKVP